VGLKSDLDDQLASFSAWTLLVGPSEMTCDLCAQRIRDLVIIALYKSTLYLTLPYFTPLSYSLAASSHHPCREPASQTCWIFSMKSRGVVNWASFQSTCPQGRLNLDPNYKSKWDI